MSVFRQKLDQFVFFHLGSDARVEFREGPQELEIAIDHPRVHPFRFSLSPEQVRELLEEPSRLEDFLLDQLTLHRRS